VPRHQRGENLVGTARARGFRERAVVLVRIEREHHVQLAKIFRAARELLLPHLPATRADDQRVRDHGDEHRDEQFNERESGVLAAWHHFTFI
jgi:hypothetical protein